MRAANYLLPLLLLPTPLLGETRVRVVHLNGLGALTGADLVPAWGIASTKLSLAGKPIRLSKYLSRSYDPCSLQNTLNAFPSQFGCYERLANSLRRFKHGPTLVVSPPMVQGGLRYVGGAARQGCGRHISRRISWVAATPASATGEPRITLSGIAIAHELAHSLGASHDESSPNIMSSNALTQAKTQDIYFLPKAASQMRQCSDRGLYR